MAKSNCDNCAYSKSLYSGSLVRYCAYILITGKRRPCEPGDGCTVKVGMKVKRRKKVKADEDC